LSLASAVVRLSLIFYVHIILGEPIPKRLLPPPDCIGFYTDPKSRGYLADPALIAEERLKLAQKYGYELPDITKDDQVRTR